MVVFPLPGAPLIHIIPFSAHSPLPQSQSVTTACAALRVWGWHFGAGYRSHEWSRASKATFDSSLASAVAIDCQNKASNWRIWRERTCYLLTSGEDVATVLVSADIAHEVTSDVGSANDIDGQLGHGWAEQEVESTTLTACLQIWSSIVSIAQLRRPHGAVPRPESPTELSNKRDHPSLGIFIIVHSIWWQ